VLSQDAQQQQSRPKVESESRYAKTTKAEQRCSRAQVLLSKTAQVAQNRWHILQVVMHQAAINT
jgi:hypothetical protein